MWSSLIQKGPPQTGKGKLQRAISSCIEKPYHSNCLQMAMWLSCLSVCSCKRSHLENYESVNLMAFSRAAVMVHIPHHYLVRNIKSLTTRSFLTQKSRRLANDPSNLDSEIFFLSHASGASGTHVHLRNKIHPPSCTCAVLTFGRTSFWPPMDEACRVVRRKCLPCCFTKMAGAIFWGSKNKYVIENRNGCLGADISTSPLVAYPFASRRGNVSYNVWPAKFINSLPEKERGCRKKGEVGEKRRGLCNFSAVTMAIPIPFNRLISNPPS